MLASNPTEEFPEPLSRDSLQSTIIGRLRTAVDLPTWEILLLRFFCAERRRRGVIYNLCMSLGLWVV